MAALLIDTPWTGLGFSPPSGLDIATLEAALLARLNAQVAGVEIAHFPDRPESYRLVHRVGAVLVRYDGADYGGIGDTAAIVQQRVVRFEVVVMVRDLGWSAGGPAGASSPGAYAILEAVRLALTGFRIPGCEKTRPLRERFIRRDQQGGVWMYAITVAVPTTAVEAGGNEQFPLLIQARAQERSGQTASGSGAAQSTFDAGGEIRLPAGNLTAVQVTAPGIQGVYTAGVDYAVDAVNGVITALAGGALSPGMTVLVAYRYADAVIAAAGGGIAPTAPGN